ncbi:TPA: hypothetical protein MIH92_24105 [Klebsiella pneumoniae]|nr:MULTISPECIES: hypothetical protein [Enterobacteriaceae]EAW3518081.1 hypothetical protein [Salmonella enterica]ECE7651236.1 hypothetical protein [Salmonella enterica subsp. enterica serovar Infantis]ECF7626444.1 hypothetical protein [Salmonella enterica subsp. enterica]EDS3894339.1 hypothetical protein [Salmonella enterica subsp. enterica serovar Reading]EEM4146157.1 hypothetical protein [Salmonella enterica subsp. enterica serovar Schwarzengrund]ELT0850923.1 hypothetical protein [Raoultell
MDYAQSKELSLHIISSMNLSVHFNKYEVDNEKDLDGIKYIIERNKANIKISTAKIKVVEPGSLLFLSRKMRDTLTATDLFIIYTDVEENQDNEITNKLRDFAFRHKTFVVQITKSRGSYDNR